jgi:hypothetical protein
MASPKVFEHPVSPYDEQHNNFTSGNTTTVYDPAGRNVGRFPDESPR